ncbi:hypothetical protein JCM18899A_34130 [Nocardioides sp. AN3]
MLRLATPVTGLSAALCGALSATVLGVSCTVVAASADPTPPPSAHDVRDARRAVAAAAGDVAGVQAALAAANERLRRSAIAAEQAEEAFNGARYRAAQAGQVARRAARRATVARADLERRRSAYASTVLASSQMAPQLTALSALGRADGIDALMERVSTIDNAQTALDLQYQRFLAASALAKAADGQARAADRDAQSARDEAATARAVAQRSADAAAAEATAITQERAVLVRRLARLQHISVATAAARQRALEHAALEHAALEHAALEHVAGTAASAAQSAPSAAKPTPEPDPTPEPTSDPTASDPAPAPQPDPDPPAPAGGASAAIAFARAQVGEPYVWGAAGPDSWDCSGLTMKAWEAGGKSLPHYSVAQYEQSTPISASQLRPGDLVFWADSASPSSIFHVALYIGDGRILHAPRTGEPVQEASMYYWTAPSFYARP